MTIYQLECFIAVAEELNFSAAAERLFTTQPAITYQINALEKETGLHLFERTTRRTKLTAAGQSFYLDMVQMTSFGRQALKKAQDIQEADRSRLTVGLRQLFDYGTFPAFLPSSSTSSPTPAWTLCRRTTAARWNSCAPGSWTSAFSTPPSTPATGTSPLRPCSRWGIMC